MSASKKRLFSVFVDDEGQSLAQFIGQRLAQTAEAAAERIRAGAVYIDGKRQIAPQQAVRAGQKVVVREQIGGESLAHRSAAANVVLAYCDDTLAVVDKPAGLPSTLPRSGGPALSHWLEQELGPCHLTHRLDQPVSGLLLVARTKIAREVFAAAHRTHQLQRWYVGIVAGDASQLPSTIDLPLSFDGYRARVSQDRRAKPAQTALRLIAQHGKRSTLSIRPLTGRSHQIRAHLAASGLPLVGDQRYGGSPASRLLLHAHRLQFHHPQDGRLIDVHSPCPEDFPAPR